MEQLEYNLLFRWFVGLSMDDPVWDVTRFYGVAELESVNQYVLRRLSMAEKGGGSNLAGIVVALSGLIGTVITVGGYLGGIALQKPAPPREDSGSTTRDNQSSPTVVPSTVAPKRPHPGSVPGRGGNSWEVARPRQCSARSARATAPPTRRGARAPRCSRPARAGYTPSPR
jgi:hypothetical protein